MYIPLLMDLLLESPVIYNGEHISHDDIIKQLTSDTLTSETILGISLSSYDNFACGGFCANALINFKVS